MTTMHWTITARMTTAVAATMLLMGCAHKEAQFGDSVRHMTEQQIFDLDAAYNPDPNPVLGGDADTLNNALEAHRNGVSDQAVTTDVRGRTQ
jgi:hypothetical protein